MAVISKDIVIVGGGVSGLTALSKLEAAGFKCALLEARERVGGRTNAQKLGNATFDLGGQWVGPSQTALLEVIAEFELKTFPTYHEGRKVLELGRKISSYKSDIPSLPILGLIDLQTAIMRIDRLAKHVSFTNPMAHPKSLFWDSVTVEYFKRRYCYTKSVRALMDVAIRTVFGAEANEMSFLFFLCYINSAGSLMDLLNIQGGAQQDRFTDGAFSVSERMYNRHKKSVSLNQTVVQIEYQADGVLITTAKQKKIKAKRAILALPPALCERIRFLPELPQNRRILQQRSFMAAMGKVFVTYKHAFWRENGFSGEAVSTSGYVSTVFDNTSEDGSEPCLLAFIAGARLRDWQALDETQRRKAVIDSLAKYFGHEAYSSIHYLEQDWTQEQYSGGGPVTLLPPGVLSAGFGKGLTEPVGPIHFAGTEAALKWCGYIDGAIRAGRSAAEAIARELPVSKARRKK